MSTIFVHAGCSAQTAAPKPEDCSKEKQISSTMQGQKLTRILSCYKSHCTSVTIKRGYPSSFQRTASDHSPMRSHHITRDHDIPMTMCSKASAYTIKNPSTIAMAQCSKLAALRRNRLATNTVHATYMYQRHIRTNSRAFRAALQTCKFKGHPKKLSPISSQKQIRGPIKVQLVSLRYPLKTHL